MHRTRQELSGESVSFFYSEGSSQTIDLLMKVMMFICFLWLRMADDVSGVSMNVIHHNMALSQLIYCRINIFLWLMSLEL